ncbi:MULTISPECIES: NAD-dependent epimerase/dehydratase family protein [unclassified Janthinobacterium]|uniref:NAD-dependent epimerase/dehydratase family protein n=1 Tax=unclassified Janthinobacterium TaxID=2610881 RepID=UPI001608B0A8|nr:MULTISPECIES: NAD-dependent epimerase/dehydratase family protein [unclassified Janthinobacterium]MBB5369984.1 nucleoside-diphosphate-sugar epimerase [Janthinobacterium sp. K2C7]MBB5382790.1 nucleoside-diphosphate-sugar epimerase [Janthinobacterium sp. K2Li3]MBB5384775.1 nucleoside-diphosphate-sugar epimerase [Janthinobacterium sp. K2E3]
MTHADFNREELRLFLTGGSGYLGRNLIRHFVAQGATVVALVRSERAATVVSALGAVPFAGDLLDPLDEGMAGCQALIHAAADTNHGYATAAQRRTNLDGTRHVFASARAAGIARAVFISSESVLLDGGPLVNAREDMPFPDHPAGAYTRTKGEAERIALALAAPGFSVVAARPRFLWGRDDTTALPQLTAAAAAGKMAWLDGGRYLTSTTHIVNACTGIALALERGRSGEAYFFSDGEPTEFRRFITALLATQGIVAPEKSVPRWLVHAIASMGDMLATLSGGRFTPPVTRQQLATMSVEVTLDISKARTHLGYQPVMPRSVGLAELVAPG